MSRGRNNRVYLSRTTMTELDLHLEDGPHTTTATVGDEPLDILAAGLERRRNKQLALDHISVTPLGTWATPALLGELGRIRAVLDRAPPDRSADLAALTGRRDDLTGTIDQARSEVARLQARKRPRKEQRRPDFELYTRQHNLAALERQADQLDQAIVGAQPASVRVSCGRCSSSRQHD